MKIHSLLPKTMQTHLDLYLSIMFNPSKLNREDKELIAVVVSIKNNCEYCMNHHIEALLHYWKDKRKILKLKNNLDLSFLTEQQQKIAEFSIKLTETPHKIQKTDLIHLRKQGCTDQEILEITLIASYFNFVNRMVLGLGVKYSEEEMKGYKY
jgi:uncharacterized peroxidase-related enzyme